MNLTYINNYKNHKYISKFQIILLIFLVLLVSCVRETEIDLNDYYTEKPVVYCIISPGEDINVLVSKTLPFGSPADSIEIVDNAVVEFTGNDSTIILDFNPQRGVYTSSQEMFPVKKGNTYNLRVALSNGTESFASATVPKESPQWVDISYNLLVRNPDNPEPSRLIEFNFYWKNDTEENCSYLVYSNDIIRSGRTQGNNFVFPNKDLNGTIMSAYYLDTYSNFSSMIKAKVSLVKVNTGFSQLHQYENQLQEISDNLDMGLFWELYRGIIPEYTNFDGGYGFFGGYLKTDTVIQF
jgi:hypothetical protein